MNTNNSHWKQLIMDFNQELSDMLQQQHHAAQFIAMAGRHLIPQQADDSNTSMQYDIDREMLVGNELPNGLRISFRLANLKLCIMDRGFNCLHNISLEGKSMEQVFKELKSELGDLKVDVNGFTNQLHYNIPVHQLDKGVTFSLKDNRHLIENKYY